MLYLNLLDLCYKNKLHHLGSYFSALHIIEKIYNTKKKDDLFILSSGHAAAALFVVIEHHYPSIKAQDLLDRCGDHPKRDEANFIHCSTGSLGLGITIAVGRALADRNRDVYCLLSDGECAEGSVWEALRFAWENKLDNLKIYVNANGYAAYDEVDVSYLIKRIKAFHPDVNIIETSVNWLPCLRGLNAHYHIMNEADYIAAKKEYYEA